MPNTKEKWQDDLDEAANEAERIAKAAGTGAYSPEAEIQREAEAIEKEIEAIKEKNAALERRKLALVKYRNVDFAGERETLTSIDARLMSEGWGNARRPGGFSLELEVDPEEVLSDELNNDNFRIVVLGNTAYIYRRSTPQAQGVEGGSSLPPLAERKRLLMEKHRNVTLAREHETVEEVDARLAQEGYESMHHRLPLNVLRNEDIEAVFREWFADPDHYLIVLTNNAALLYKKRPDDPSDLHREYKYE